MRSWFPKNNKKGITLVESVFAVIILGIFATGILSLLTSGGIKIQQISGEASVYTEATQKMDMVISSISNGSTEYIQPEIDETTGKICKIKLKSEEDLESMLGVNDFEVQINVYDESVDSNIPTNIRGWYLKLTFDGVTIKGFASNSWGVFDN